jgi:hypothetical protein
LSRLDIQDVAFEEVENALDELAHLRERWDNRLTVNNLALAERYIKRELNIVVEWMPVDWGGIHLRAILQRKLLIGGREIDGLGRRSGESWECVGPEFGWIYSDANGAMSRPYRYDRLVFVEDVELVDAPQGFIPTLVRFQIIHKSPRLAAGPLYRFAGSGFKHVFGLPEGELDMIVAGSLGVAVADDFDRKEVEGGSDVVDRVADNGAPIDWNAFPYADLPDALSSIRIVVRQDNVWILGEERLDFPGKLSDVALGPFDL